MMKKLSYPAHARATLVLGLPLIGSHVAQFGLHVTDTIMLGWYSIPALAAVVLGASTFFVVFILGSGFGQAVMPMVARAIGAGEDAEVRRATRMGLWLSVLFGVLSYPVMWWSGALLRGLGQEPEVAGLAQDYLRIAGLGMVPALLVMVLKSYLAALERTQVVLWTTVAAVGLNVAVNWALIFGNWGAPELGLQGAAVASVTVQVATLVVLAIYAGWLPELRRFALFQRMWRPDWIALGQVFRLGWPIGLTGLAEGGLFSASALMMGLVGTQELAAHGIALEISALTFMVHLGLSNAATIRVGRAHGQGDHDGLRRGAFASIALSLAFGSAVVAIFLLTPEPLISAFLSRDEPGRDAIIAIGTVLLAMAALFQFADAAQVMVLGLLRGLQDTRVPMIIAAISYWVVGIPVSYLLGIHFGWGGVGVWAGLVVGLAIAAVLLSLRFARYLQAQGRSA